MKKTRSSNPCDRYLYDFVNCKSSDGWAQVDTEQDASYFGNWANPFTFEFMSYTEGDVCHTICDNRKEFAAELQSMKDCYEKVKVDPGLQEHNIRRWSDIALSQYLY